MRRLIFASLLSIPLASEATIEVAPTNPSASDYVVMSAEFSGCIESTDLVRSGTTLAGRIVYQYPCFTTPPGGRLSFAVGWLPPGDYVVTVESVYTDGVPKRAPQTGAFSVSPAPPLPPNYQGLWWAPSGSEAGWGLNIAHQGDTIVATWFTYDAWKGLWLVMTAPKIGPNTYAGKLVYTRGPAFNTVPFDPTKVGTYYPPWEGVLHFDDDNNGTFTYTAPPLLDLLPPIVQSKRITRQAFGPLPICQFAALSNSALATNYTDLWWAEPAGSESGWGISLTHQGATIFATWFTYDVDGSSMWLVATAPKSGFRTYAGTLYRTTGPAYFVSEFDPAKVAATPVGTLTLAFQDGNHATMSYAVAGTAAQAKQITREVFVAPGTVCN